MGRRGNLVGGEGSRAFGVNDCGDVFVVPGSSIGVSLSQGVLLSVGAAESVFKLPSFVLDCAAVSGVSESGAGCAFVEFVSFSIAF